MLVPIIDGTKAGNIAARAALAAAAWPPACS